MSEWVIGDHRFGTNLTAEPTGQDNEIKIHSRPIGDGHRF